MVVDSQGACPGEQGCAQVKFRQWSLYPDLAVLPKEANDSRYCGHCGTALPVREDAPPSSVPFADKAQRFEALAGNEQTARWMATTPQPPSTAKDMIGAFIGLFIAVTVGIVGAVAMASACPPMGLLPLVIAGALAYKILQQMKRTAENDRAPLVRKPSLVVEERTKISGNDDSSTTTRYYTTLEYETGERQEFETAGEMAGKLTAGDMGVAFVKGDLLIEFGRVPV